MERTLRYRLLVTSGAIVAAAVHVVFPQIVPDAITAGLIALAILPWLAPLVRSVEIPGVGKVELQQVQRDLLEAKGAALSAERKADFVAEIAPTRGVGLTPIAPTPTIEALAAEYNEIRATQRSGAARTASMTTVVRRMIDALGPSDTFDVMGNLSSKDRGKRLSAYAYLYSRQRPDTSLLDSLVNSLVNIEDKPFGQYWGLQALSRMLGRLDRATLKPDTVAELDKLLGRLRPGTDRHYELSRILSGIETADRRLTRDGADGAED